MEIKTQAQAGVAILKNEEFERAIICYEQTNERIISVKLKVKRWNLTVVKVYTPQEGRKKESEEFYQQLQEVIDEGNKNYFLVIAGDLNARIGNVLIPGVLLTCCYHAFLFLRENYLFKWIVAFYGTKHFYSVSKQKESNDANII